MTSEDVLAVIRKQITHSAPVADLRERAEALAGRADILEALPAHSCTSSAGTRRRRNETADFV